MPALPSCWQFSTRSCNWPEHGKGPKGAGLDHAHRASVAFRLVPYRSAAGRRVVSMPVPRPASRWGCHGSRGRCGKGTARSLRPLPWRTKIKPLSKDIEDAQCVERVAPAEGPAMTPIDVALLGPDRVQHWMDGSSQVLRDRKRLCREAESRDTDHMRVAIWRRPCGRTSRDRRIPREPGSAAPPTSRPI
jgi:hypothetical protein